MDVPVDMVARAAPAAPPTNPPTAALANVPPPDSPLTAPSDALMVFMLVINVSTALFIT